MSDDFDDGFEDAMFSSADEVAPSDRALGLVVPPTARQIFGPSGEIVFDELPLLEMAYRRDGRPSVTFDEGAAPEPWT